MTRQPRLVGFPEAQRNWRAKLWQYISRGLLTCVPASLCPGGESGGWCCHVFIGRLCVDTIWKAESIVALRLCAACVRRSVWQFRQVLHLFCTLAPELQAAAGEHANLPPSLASLPPPSFKSIRCAAHSMLLHRHCWPEPHSHPRVPVHPALTGSAFLAAETDVAVLSVGTGREGAGIARRRPRLAAGKKCSTPGSTSADLHDNVAFRVWRPPLAAALAQHALAVVPAGLGRGRKAARCICWPRAPRCKRPSAWRLSC